MAIKRIPASAIHAGQPYRDGEIITGTMVNEVVKVLKDGVNYNKFFIDAMFAGTTEEAIVIGVPKGTLNTTAEDIAQLDDFITDNSITVDDGQKAFVFRCIYGNVDDPTEITGVQALNYFKYVTDEWVYQYAVSMDTFIQGLSSDFTDYPNIVEPSLDSVLVVQDDNVLNRVSLQNVKNVLGVTELLEVTVPAIEQDIAEILEGTQTVKKSQQDASGNVITTTYETKADATSKKAEIDGRLDTAESEINNIKNGTTIVKKAEQDGSGNVITSTYETKIDATSKLATKVDKTTKVIGLDLQDDILLTEFKTALGNATQSVAGLLSAEDKTHLDGLVALLESSDGNTVVDTIGEILAIFNDYPEGADLVTVLNGKVDKVAGKGLSQNDFTDALKNKLDGLLNGNQYYDKNYIDALKDQNGWESELLTLTPLAPSGTIATATLLLYNTLKLQVKNTTTSFVDTDSVEVSLGVVTGNKIQLSDTSVYLEIGATNSTFVAPAGWQLQIVGLKYTELKAVDTTYDGTGTNYLTAKDNTQTAITELDTQVKASNDAIALRELLANKAIDFSTVNDTKYPTTKAVSERLLNLPIAELNNHSLREVFEGGIVNDNPYFNKPSGWNTQHFPQSNEGILKNSTATYPNTNQTNKLINGNTYYFNVKRKALSDNTIALSNSFVQLGSSVYNSSSEEYSNVVIPNASSNTAIYINNNVATGLNMSIQYERYVLINLTSLNISSITVQQMDYWFNVYQALLVSDTNAIFSLFAPKQQEAWLTPTLTGATSTYIRYRKDTLGTVIVEGNITVKTAGTNLTLPVGYRPLFAYTVGILTFNTDGTVVSSATGTQTLSVRYTGA